MDSIDRESEVLLPRSQWSRRGFVMTSLATGFALSVQPVLAEVIHTDTTGLEAGEVKVPVRERIDPGIPGDAGQGRAVSYGARRPGDLRRARAH